MEILTTEGLSVKVTPGKGRGVFAARDFHKGETLTVNAVLVFTEIDANKIGETALGSYHFSWPYGPNGEDLDADKTPYSCVPFGLISLINHGRGEEANASWFYSREQMTMIAVALRDIATGQEILWDYHWDSDGDEEDEDATPENAAIVSSE